ncbi:MAG: type II secretion system secretin GspD [Pseudomonadota bacterium]
MRMNAEPRRRTSLLRYRSSLVALAFSLLLAGCETVETRSDSATSDPQLEAALSGLAHNSLDDSTAGTEIGGFEDQPPKRPKRPPDLLYPAKGELVGAAAFVAGEEPFTDSADGVSLNFNATPLAEVAKTILGDILGENYRVEPGLQGQVTMATARPVRRDALIPILESILQANGAVMVKGEGGAYRVGPRTLLKGVAPLVPPSISTPGYSIRIVPLNFIAAEEMSKILEPLAAPDNVLRVDKTRNLLVLGGTRHELAGIMQLIDTFDVDVLKGMSVGLYSVENVAPGQMAEMLNQVFGEGGESPLAGLFRIVPLEHLNRVLVVTSRAKYLKQVSTWIRRLDLGDGTQSKLYVYPVQNGDAADVAALLTQIFGDGGGARRPARPEGDVAPGRQAATLGGDNAETGADAGATTGRSSNRRGGGGGGSSLRGLAEETGGDVRVVADTTHNTLLIMAPPSAYRTITAALRRLDTQPLQVLIEASIVEVTLSDELEYGTQWFFENELGDDKLGTGSLNTSILESIGPKVPGFNFTISDSAGVINAVFHALAEDSRLRVISTPSVLVLDNRTAEIRVGDQQPVSTGSSTTDGGVVTENFEFKDTGVLLTVTPRVNAGGLVIMEVTQEVTDVGPIDVGATNQRSFLQRTITTTVAVQSGDTIVLGGLIRDNSSRSDSGLPVLHKIPVVGGLFGTKNSSVDRTELLVTLTPRALRNNGEILQAGEDLRLQMRQMLGDLGESSL